MWPASGSVYCDGCDLRVAACTVMDVTCEWQRVLWWLWPASGSVYCDGCDLRVAVCTVTDVTCEWQFVLWWMWPASGSVYCDGCDLRVAVCTVMDVTCEWQRVLWWMWPASDSVYCNGCDLRVAVCTVMDDWRVFGKEYLVRGDRGSTVVKVLCYKSEGPWFDPSWCQWIFHWQKILPIALRPWDPISLWQKWVPEVFSGVKPAGA